MAGTMDRIGAVIDAYTTYVSMKSGLDGRNNQVNGFMCEEDVDSLNEVRPRWPEQYVMFHGVGLRHDRSQ